MDLARWVIIVVKMLICCHMVMWADWFSERREMLCIQKVFMGHCSCGTILNLTRHFYYLKVRPESMQNRKCWANSVKKQIYVLLYVMLVVFSPVTGWTEINFLFSPFLLIEAAWLYNLFSYSEIVWHKAAGLWLTGLSLCGHSFFHSFFTTFKLSDDQVHWMNPKETCLPLSSLYHLQ